MSSVRCKATEHRANWCLQGLHAIQLWSCCSTGSISSHVVLPAIYIDCDELHLRDTQRRKMWHECLPNDLQRGMLASRA